MDYQQPPTLCIRSAEPSATPGYVILDMPSLWTDDGIKVVQTEAYEFITGGRYDVPVCPPGYPNPPEFTEVEGEA